MSSVSSRTTFNIVDIARVLAGILLLNAVASWWFTSSPTWGYSGKWINQRYLKHRIFGSHVTLTIQELSLRNGSDENLPIYIAIDGRVYDVTASRHIYGPQGPYSFFSGKDASRAFVTGCFRKADEFTYDLRGLDPEEAKADIQSWQDYFEKSSKYWCVGTVIHDPLTGDPPEPCDHKKYPHL
ncbi:hypothetical protein JCM33374_g733 [Metschnikowia sp. JCM 33374]|nr:hypothetical protein JCM33374_g733 [Metschnikowia sp. JCM 33374]